MDSTLEMPLETDSRNITSNTPAVEPLLSYATLEFIVFLTFYFLAFPLSLLGVLTNTANLIVYFKMGFSESSNVNFFVLSMFDYLSALNSVVGRICYGPIFRGTSFSPALQYIGECLYRAMTVTIGGSAMMTALISTERCLGVVFPLKVKTWLSYRRNISLMLVVVTYQAIFLIILYADLGPPYDVFLPREAFYTFSLYVIPLNICFFAVIFNTSLLAIRLKVSQQWRKETSVQGAASSNKEDKVARTIIFICIIFICCSFPFVVFYIAQMMYPRFNFNDVYLGTFNLLCQDINALCQMVSASLNIVFYYKLSSRFRKVFRDRFACNRRFCALSSQQPLNESKHA